LRVKHCGRKPVAIGDELSQHGHRGRKRSFDFAHDTAEIEGEFGIELACQLLHAQIVGETRHVHQLYAAVARGKQGALQ